MKKKLISVAMCVNKLDINGMSTVIMNYCRYIDKDKFKVTVIAGSPIDIFYQEELRTVGINFVEIAPKKTDARGYYSDLYQYLRKEKIDVFHLHGNSSLMSVELFIASICGIKIRIAHCHNTSCSNETLHRLLLPVFNKVYTKGIACSDAAGRWLFGGRDFSVIWNGFNQEQFVFNSKDRECIRREIGVSNGFVIGHIGRMNEQKNQEFLLKVFSELSKVRNDVWLLLVGTGPSLSHLEDLVSSHEYKNRIILYGETSTPEQLYSAFDIFAFPSKFEGFGMVMTEAQVNGLPCVASTEVPQDVVISKNVKFLSISENDVSTWAKEIDEIINSCDVSHRGELDNNALLRFDIKSNVQVLEDIYAEIIGAL